MDRRQPGRLQISIHALREEGDAAHAVRLIAAGLFLSTPSARRATNRLEYEVVGHGFLSTPSARRATIPAITSASSSGISIHALREEGDETLANYRQVNEISIHALREEGDAGSSAAKEST